MALRLRSLSPFRGRVGVRGSIRESFPRESNSVEAPPHPDLLPLKGEKERGRCATRPSYGAYVARFDQWIASMLSTFSLPSNSFAMRPPEAL
jgi:hypothetical protein